MKMQTNTDTIVRSGIQSENRFKIVADAKAFEVLSSSLYKDPVLAIVREVSCNAYDAHVSVGKKDLPFEIHLPSSIEPYFYVKDWGPGLSHEDICDPDKGLYTTYFASTKTNNNDEIGAFGLGCKSPYSYSDSFQVISRHAEKSGVMKRTYTMYMNEDRLPVVALMQEAPTDEQPGLEVRIAVKDRDYYEFRSKTAAALRFFEVKPRVTGVNHFEFQSPPERTYSSDTWIVNRRSSSYSNGEVLAVMGQVPYKVNVDKLVPHLPVGTASFLRTLDVVAFFGIGELEVPPDREEVRYNDRTLRALISRVNDIRKMFLVQIEERVSKDTSATYWEKFQAIRAISQDLFNNDKDLATFIQKESTNVDLIRYCEAIKNNGLVIPGPLAGHTVTLMNNTTGNRVNVCLEKKQTTADLLEGDDDVRITVFPSKKHMIVYDDINRGSMKRLRQHLADIRRTGGFPDKIIMIRKLTDKDARNMGWPHDLTKVDQNAELNLVVDALGNPAVLKLSSLKNSGPAHPRYALPVYTFSSVKHRRYSADKINWKSGVLTDEIKQKGGLYFLLENGTKITDHNGNHITWTSNYEACMKATVALINDANKTQHEWNEVIAVSKLSYNRIVGNKKWKNVFKEAADVVSNYKDEILQYRGLMASHDVFGVKALLANNSPSGYYNRPTEKQRALFGQLLEGLLDTSVMKRELLPFVQTAMSLSKEKVALLESVSLFDEKITKTYGDQKGTVLLKANTINKLQDEYPMLSFMSRIEYNKLTEFFDYVSLVDRSKV